jgi:predicted metal-dependent hydrolase
VTQGVLPFGDPVASATVPRAAAGPTVPEFVRHPRARRYIVRVRHDGSVRVTIPRRGSRRQAEAFLAEQRAWVERQRQRIASHGDSPRPAFTRDEVRGFRRSASLELPRRLLQLASRLGLTVARISVRNQRTRWGSCSPSGHISLNWRLITLPDWVCEYVLVHELMHLRRLDHSPAFWRLVAAACPRYQEARAWLRHRPPTA